jgi:hypothetical protein
MAISREQLEDIIFGAEGSRSRYTQDSPILPDVWFEYVRGPHPRRVRLLLTPHRNSNAAELADWVAQRVARERGTAFWKRWHEAPDPGGDQLTYNESTVSVRLSFPELVRGVLPLTQWWCRYVFDARDRRTPAALSKPAMQRELTRQLLRRDVDEDNEDMAFLMNVVGHIALALRPGAAPDAGANPEPAAVVAAAAEMLAGVSWREIPPEPVLWSVNRDRRVTLSVWRSVPATKADAAMNLFELDCSNLRWAVIDSGIDATHPAFRRRDKDGRLAAAPFAAAEGQASNSTRVEQTLDFSRIRRLLSFSVEDKAAAVPPQDGGEVRRAAAAEADGADPSLQPVLQALSAGDRQRVIDLKNGLRKGRSIDWRAMEILLRVPHTAAAYLPPDGEHGTHVAGILAGDWRTSDTPRSPDNTDLRGVCPDLRLFDLRVMDGGEGSEFAVLAALQYVRWLNANKDEPVIHGVNISLSLLHDVSNFACGRTPVCDECERLVASGVVVVAAAGNEGHAQFVTSRGAKEGYRSISITDPGNADAVITVGATHRFKPHTYGVSFFSSRGPTGDGRSKPDLVAPGEKIRSAIPNARAKTLDGTSMAAPHVSGAAALLIARHVELMGRPAQIKKILCSTATDLGRERFFQGAGMVDVLRAIQSV